MTGKIGDDGASESMLVGTSIRLCSAKKLGLSRCSCSPPRDHHLGQRDQFASQPGRGAVGDVAAAERRADGDQAAHARVGLKEERLAQRLLDVVRGLDQLERLLADDLPIVVAAVERLQLGDQPAHAVPDEHHLIERRLLVLGIERLRMAARSSRSCAALYQNGWPVGYR